MIELADTGLVIRVEADAEQPGDEFRTGFGKTARDGMHLRAATAEPDRATARDHRSQERSGDAGAPGNRPGRRSGCVAGQDAVEQVQGVAAEDLVDAGRREVAVLQQGS
jgi:Urease alpha-subunit, N-terminal domain